MPTYLCFWALLIVCIRMKVVGIKLTLIIVLVCCLVMEICVKCCAKYPVNWHVPCVGYCHCYVITLYTTFQYAHLLLGLFY